MLECSFSDCSVLIIHQSVVVWEADLDNVFCKVAVMREWLVAGT